MKKVLLIATIYRCGEKIYPIIPHLCKDYELDILMFNQMSVKSPWYGDRDPRSNFYDFCQDWGANVIQGLSNKEVGKCYKNGKRLSSKIRNNKYDLVILDDNKTKDGWGTPALCRHMRDKGSVVIGSPHGNYDFALSNLDNKFNNILDFSFVFGNKEKSGLATGKNTQRLIPSGIPSNDCLATHTRKNDYILVIVNYVEGHNRQKRDKNGYMPFNEDVFLKSGILDIQQNEGLKVVIKEKSRYKKGLSLSLKHLEKYDGVSVIMDHPDNDQLIAGAKYVISAPSTMAFKSIQMGIPTILIKRFGMVGNFYDFEGHCDLDANLIKNSLDSQVEKGICAEFIKETLTGGLEFNSTDIYLESIREILNGRRHF